MSLKSEQRIQTFFQETNGCCSALNQLVACNESHGLGLNCSAFGGNSLISGLAKAESFVNRQINFNLGGAGYNDVNKS